MSRVQYICSRHDHIRVQNVQTRLEVRVRTLQYGQQYTWYSTGLQQCRHHVLHVCHYYTKYPLAENCLFINAIRYSDHSIAHNEAASAAGVQHRPHELASAAGV